MAEPCSIERWLSLTGSILAPAGAVTALLFYFGYASTRAKDEYFGVDVDTVGLDLRSLRGAGLPLHRFPLEHAAEAHAAVEAGVVGKVLIDVI